MKLIKFHYSIDIIDRIPTFLNLSEYLGYDQHEIIKNLYLQSDSEQFKNFIDANTLITHDLQRWKDWIKEIFGCKKKKYN
jgi:hypothetical protein